MQTGVALLTGRALYLTKDDLGQGGVRFGAMTPCNRLESSKDKSRDVCATINQS